MGWVGWESYVDKVILIKQVFEGPWDGGELELVLVQPDSHSKYCLYLFLLLFDASLVLT